MSSVPTRIKFVPVVGNPVVLVKVIFVPDPPVPKALALSDPFNVVVCGAETVPPH